MAVAYAYLAISPDPREYTSKTPRGNTLPWPSNQRTQIPAVPQGGHAAVFHVKLGDHSQNQAQSNGTFDAYKRANPDLWFQKLEIEGPTWPDNNGVGKVLQTMVLDWYGSRAVGKVFKHIGWGEEWYYAFHHEAELNTLVANCTAANFTQLNNALMALLTVWRGNGWPEWTNLGHAFTTTTQIQAVFHIINGASVRMDTLANVRAWVATQLPGVQQFPAKLKLGLDMQLEIEWRIRQAQNLVWLTGDGSLRFANLLVAVIFFSMNINTE